MATNKTSRFLSTIELSWKTLLGIASVGAGVGLLTWLVNLLFQSVLIEPVFCRSADSFQACANGGTISIVIATILTNILGLIALVRLRVYRPLLVVIASIVTLFGVHVWTGAMSWYEATAWYALIYAISYALYAWLARTLSFAITLIALVIVIVLFRVFLAQL